MVHSVNDWFIQLLGEVGEDGLIGAGTSAVTVMSAAGASVGGVPPAGATSGTLVINPTTGVIYQVGTPPGGGALQLLLHPRMQPPVSQHGLRGTPGNKGVDGEVPDHPHSAVRILYRPRTYADLWTESYYPILPNNPVVEPGFILTSGVGNTVQVKLPPPAGNKPHPYNDPVVTTPERPDIPEMDLSRLRVVVTRGQPTPLSPWLGLTRIDYTEVLRPGDSQTIDVALPAAWPVSATDNDLWITAYLWDVAGNGPVASQSIKAASIVYQAPPAPDRTPPGAPTVAVRWDPNTLTYTVTVTAPADPDIREIRVWQRPDGMLPSVEGLTPKVLPSTPGQVHTFTFQPTANAPTPPTGYIVDPAVVGRPHDVVMAAWYAQAFDNNMNAGNPGLTSDYQPASKVVAIPPHFPTLPNPPVTGPGAGGGAGGGIQQPGDADVPEDTGNVPVAPGARPSPVTVTVGGVRSKSRGYSQRGSQTSYRWGQGLIATGYYSGTNGVQWGGVWMDLSRYRGRTVESMTLEFRTTHTWSNAGADVNIGIHSYRNGLPGTLRGNTASASFGLFGRIHVPKSGRVTFRVPNFYAQDFLDGQAFGFLFGGRNDTGTGQYALIDFSSIKVTVRIR